MESMKIRILNEEHSKQVQEKLFEMGCYWARYNSVSKNWFKSTSVHFTDALFLIRDLDGCITYCCGVEYFEEQQDYQEYVFENGEFQKVGQQGIIQEPEIFTDAQATQILARAKDKLSSPSAQLIYVVEEMLRSHKALFTHHFES